MKKVFAVTLFAPAAALAHPGHGLAGVLHPHAADYALIGFGIFVLVMGAYALRKALKK
jgi:hypothetical protein